MWRSILAGADGTDTAALERISVKYPTSAIAVLAVAGGWAALRTGPGGADRLPRSALEIVAPAASYELVASVSSISLMACPQASMPGA